MESCKLEIVLHSGNSLNDVKIFGTMDPYVVVWISGGGKETKALETEVAKRGGSFPVWNYSMDFNISSMNNSYTLFYEIKHDGHMVDRNIGQVQIPFKDLLAGDSSGENVSYPVKIWSGEVKGEIILSHKFSQPEVNEKDSFGNVTDSPKKKGDQKKNKKKNGMMKRIGKTVVTQVASRVILLAGMAGQADLHRDPGGHGPPKFAAPGVNIIGFRGNLIEVTNKSPIRSSQNKFGPQKKNVQVPSMARLIVALDDGSSMSASVDVEVKDEDEDQDQDQDQDQDDDNDNDNDEDEGEDKDEDQYALITTN